MDASQGGSVKDLYGKRSLSEKELRIIELVSEGLENRDVGAQMGLSREMVRNYLRVIFDKLGVWTRLELALWWVSREG